MAHGADHAILNRGRLNAFRLNYIPAGLKLQRETVTTVTLNGAPLRVRLGSMTIRDIINDAPNTCTFIADHATPPTVGQRLRVTLGVDPTLLLFVGALQRADETYVGTPAVRAWSCEAIDDTKRADWLRPFGAWEGVSASVVAQQLVASFAPGFTTAHVQAGLPPVTIYLDGSERLNGALKLLAKLVGGYYYFEDYDLHFFTGEEVGRADPADITPTSKQLLDEPAITYDQDDAQIRTRCFGKGHQEPTLAEVGPGETRIPIRNAVMFNPAGGLALAEWRRLTYTGIALGGAGALVGPGVTPSSGLTLALASGAGIDPGAHGYAYTWVTAAGETPPSPLATITHGAIAAPAAAPVFLGHGGPIGTNDAGDPGATGTWRPGDTVEIGYSYATAENTTMMTALSPTMSVVAVAASGLYPSGQPAKSLYIQLAYSTDVRVTYMIVWHRVNGGPWRWWRGLTNHPSGYGGVYPTDLGNGNIYSAGGASPPAGALNFNQTAVSDIAVGPAAVTARKLYRTLAGQGILKLLTTLANNTTTTYQDTTADASLGAAAPPATDTSGLQMPAGIVAAGSTSLMVAGTSWTTAGGGWAIIGNGDQLIRYTGTTGNTLIGIPTTGRGAIVAPINYNSTVTGAPMLLGVSGITATILEGTGINLFIQVEDTGAQASLAARVGGSGIIENLIVDERRGLPSLQALCAADLAMYGQPAVTVRFTSFDPRTRSGCLIRITLPSLALDQNLRIQDVTIEQLGMIGVRPRFTATAGSNRTSLEDLLRRMVGTLEEGF